MPIAEDDSRILRPRGRSHHHQNPIPMMPITATARSSTWISAKNTAAVREMYRLKPGWHGRLARDKGQLSTRAGTASALFGRGGLAGRRPALRQDLVPASALDSDRCSRLCPDAQRRSRLAHGYGGRTLPFYKNFFVGGIGTVRGFEEQSSLGPTITQTDGSVGQLGGNRKLVGAEFISRSGNRQGTGVPHVGLPRRGTGVRTRSSASPTCLQYGSGILVEFAGRAALIQSGWRSSPKRATRRRNSSSSWARYSEDGRH